MTKVFSHQGTDVVTQVRIIFLNFLLSEKFFSFSNNAVTFHSFQIKIYEKMIPVWAGVIIIVVCLCFSSLFSGLNLGLMSMDKTELKILCNTGK